MLENRAGNRHYLLEKSLYLARAPTGCEAKSLGSATRLTTSGEVVYSSPKETRMGCSRKRYSRCRISSNLGFWRATRLGGESVCDSCRLIPIL